MNYRFKKDWKVAYRDSVAFARWADGLITKKQAIEEISKNNGVEMTEEEFDYEARLCGYARRASRYISQ